VSAPSAQQHLATSGFILPSTSRKKLEFIKNAQHLMLVNIYKYIDIFWKITIITFMIKTNINILNKTNDLIFGNSSLIYNEIDIRSRVNNFSYDKIKLGIEKLYERSVSLGCSTYTLTIECVNRIFFHLKGILDSSWVTWNIIAVLNTIAQGLLMYYLEDFSLPTLVYAYFSTIFYMSFTKELLDKVSNFSSLIFYENLLSIKNIVLLPFVVGLLLKYNNIYLNTSLNYDNFYSSIVISEDHILRKLSNVINELHFISFTSVFMRILYALLYKVEIGVNSILTKEEFKNFKKELKNWYSSFNIPVAYTLSIINPDNTYALYELAKFYKESDNDSLSVAYLEKILKSTNNDNKKIKKYAIKRLKIMYESTNNIHGLVKCCKKYLLNYHELPKENSIFNILKFFKNIPTSEASEKLKFLKDNTELWIGKFQPPFTLDQWKHIIESKDYLKQLVILYQQYITMPKNMNKDLFLNDPTMPKWNVLIQPEEDVDDNGWESYKTCLSDIANSLTITNEAKKASLIKFFNQCMLTAEAKRNATGKQMTRKRIAAIIDYLNNLKIKFEKSTDNAEKELLKKQIEGALKIMIDGGNACPDRTAVCLTKLEIYIKLLQNPKYLPNIMVLMYKFEMIKDYTTDPNQAENIETFLYNCLFLNEVLGLGLEKQGQIREQMLHLNVARKMPMMQILGQLDPGFNIEGVLEFTTIQEIFKSIYEEEMKVSQAVMEAGYAFLEADDDYEDAKNSKQSQEEINRLHSVAEKKQLEWEQEKHAFYKMKAKDLFEEAGFIKAEL